MIWGVARRHLAVKAPASFGGVVAPLRLGWGAKSLYLWCFFSDLVVGGRYELYSNYPLQIVAASIDAAG
jgi:hypothetical protein